MEIPRLALALVSDELPRGLASRPYTSQSVTRVTIGMNHCLRAPAKPQTRLPREGASTDVPGRFIKSTALVEFSVIIN